MVAAIFIFDVIGQMVDINDQLQNLYQHLSVKNLLATPLIILVFMQPVFEY